MLSAFKFLISSLEAATSSALAAGELELPVIEAVWFLINTDTLSPSLVTAVVETGVNISEPSSFT